MRVFNFLVSPPLKMKSFVILFAFVAIAAVESEQEWRLDLIEPKGFKISMKHQIQFKSVTIGGDIWHTPYRALEDQSYVGSLTLQNDWWIYKNLTANLSPGDKTIFAIAPLRKGHQKEEVADLVVADYVIPENATRISV